MTPKIVSGACVGPTERRLDACSDTKDIQKPQLEAKTHFLPRRPRSLLTCETIFSKRLDHALPNLGSDPLFDFGHGHFPNFGRGSFPNLGRGPSPNSGRGPFPNLGRESSFLT